MSPDEVRVSLPPVGFPRRAVLCVLSALVVLLCAACQSSGRNGARHLGTLTTPAAPTLDFAPADGAHLVRLDAPVMVRSAGAALAAVLVAAPDGAALAGSYTPDHTGWQSSAALAPGTRYQAMARTQAGPDRPGVTKTSTFTTLTPKVSLKVSWEPTNGQTVGIGSPVSLQFSAPVTDRAAVQRRLLVRSAPAVEGAWHWFSNQELRWRPRSYWTPGTRVRVEAMLAGYDAGEGVWGVKDRTMDVRIGEPQISYVDAQKHTMTVTRNGRVLRVMPVSVGREQYPTMDGPHNVIETDPSVIMDSATVGIPKGSPDYYHETVFWNVKITSGGEYVHAAPWSVGSQGRVNVSHGCVNASPSNAQWFYGISKIGDIVNVTGTGRPPDTSQEGNDWSMSWAQWTAGDALAASAPATSSIVSPARTGA